MVTFFFFLHRGFSFNFFLSRGTVISIHPESTLDYTSPIAERLTQPDSVLRTSEDASLLVQSLLDLGSFNDDGLHRFPPMPHCCLFSCGPHLGGNGRIPTQDPRPRALHPAQSRHGQRAQPYVIPLSSPSLKLHRASSPPQYTSSRAT